MQARTTLLSLFALSIIITGCPFSNSIPFSDKSSADKFDKSLLGTWENDESEVEANEVVITKGKAVNTYKIKVSKRGETFEASTDLFTGWTTTAKNIRFLVLQEELESGPGDEYYLYTIEFNDKNLVTHYVNYDVDEGSNAETINEFQKQVLESRYSEDFLEGEIEWSKK